MTAVAMNDINPTGINYLMRKSSELKRWNPTIIGAFVNKNNKQVNK